MKFFIIIFAFIFSSNALADFAHINPSDKVDVIFIVDDSASMTPFQQKLSSNLDALLEDFRNSDAHFGILTTSATRGAFAFPYTPGVFLGTGTSGSFDQVVGALKKDILVGTDGNAEEKPFDVALMALSEPYISNENKGFLRPNIPLILVIITDEPDQSSVTAKQFADQLVVLKGDSSLSLYGYIPKDNTCGQNEPHTNIPEAAGYLGGKTYNLCDDDWSKNKIHFH